MFLPSTCNEKLQPSFNFCNEELRNIGHRINLRKQNTMIDTAPQKKENMIPSYRWQLYVCTGFYCSQGWIYKLAVPAGISVILQLVVRLHRIML